jgi:hypothetical protein
MIIKYVKNDSPSLRIYLQKTKKTKASKNKPLKNIIIKTTITIKIKDNKLKKRSLP